MLKNSFRNSFSVFISFHFIQAFIFCHSCYWSLPWEELVGLNINSSSNNSQLKRTKQPSRLQNSADTAQIGTKKDKTGAQKRDIFRGQLCKEAGMTHTEKERQALITMANAGQCSHYRAVQQTHWPVPEAVAGAAHYPKALRLFMYSSSCTISCRYSCCLCCFFILLTNQPARHHRQS